MRRSAAPRSWSTCPSYGILRPLQQALTINSSRPEAAFVLLLIQSLIWLVTGLSAAPFALAGEIHMAALALATMLLALGTLLCGVGIVWRRSKARGLAIALELVCLAGSALLFVLPIGFNHGLVSIVVNVALPLAVIVLLAQGRQAFS